jgi:hypothetical protein
MRRVRLFTALIPILPALMLVCTPAAGQPAMPTTDILGRVLMVKSPVMTDLQNIVYELPSESARSGTG